MNTLNELKAALAKIEEQISALSSEKNRIEAEIEGLERQQAKEALDKILGELKALNIDPNEIAKALGFSASTVQQKKYARSARHGDAQSRRGAEVQKFRRCFADLDRQGTETGMDSNLPG